ncbi:unnamed protein product [Rhizoctonia solani]|uniref:Coilin n=1 Tax=Rhizoctonia solani TaxID=456999 RepID=A0A8H2WQ80_9AGAM|nr:unnamed protein product [Rhizoctonia solani]
MNSTFTRFRVQTASPLEPIKAWHVISPEQDIQSIEDLTGNIIQTLGLAEVDGEIILELDGFALLPSSPVGVVRDGDVVTVRCKSRPDKRKATDVTTTPTPAPVNEPVVATQVKASVPIAPAKNANKNKRKGFDKDMATTVATRITYGAPTPSAVSVEPSARVNSPALPTAAIKSRYTHYHVVPPSQLNALPSNVIVTSVDVEAVNGMEGVGEWFDGANRVAEENKPPANDESQPKSNTTSTKIDWEVVDSEWERLWDSFPAVEQATWNSLQAGTLLAYLGLAIDPVTCTPCSKIHVARVVSGPSDGKAECFFIDRPGAGDVGFGFGGKFEITPEAQDMEDEESGETRSVAFAEVREWKMVP